MYYKNEKMHDQSISKLLSLCIIISIIYCKHATRVLILPRVVEKDTDTNSDYVYPII